MAYYMEQTDSKFCLWIANEEKAMEAIKNWFKAGNVCRWINSNNVINARSFKDVMRECRFEVERIASDLAYDSIEFTGEKYSGDELAIFNCIAPYVSSGSYIQMKGEEGELWRWVFENGACHEEDGEIVFKSESPVKREFYIDTPLGKLKVWAKHDEDDPENFPGVFIDLVNKNGEENMVTCVEYESFHEAIEVCVYQPGDDFPICIYNPLSGERLD